MSYDKESGVYILHKVWSKMKYFLYAFLLKNESGIWNLELKVYKIGCVIQV